MKMKFLKLTLLEKYNFMNMKILLLMVKIMLLKVCFTNVLNEEHTVFDNILPKNICLPSSEKIFQHLSKIIICI